MGDSHCIFCKILNGEIPSVKIHEDDDFLAILDAFPNRRGMTLVLSKDHYSSDLFQLEDVFFAKYIQFTKKVVQIIKKGLKVDRVGLVIEGLEVDHAHIKLYPFYEGIGFQTGVGSGSQKSIEELKLVAEEIKINCV